MDNSLLHQTDLPPATLDSQDTAEYEPTPDALTVGAYFRYVDQGWHAGHALNDWLDAERLIEHDSRLLRRVG